MTTQTIPVFRFGSKQLNEWKNQFMVENEITIERSFLNFSWGEFISYRKSNNIKRMVWRISGIQYIIDHGGFKTLETSVAYQQNTLSTNIVEMI